VDLVNNISASILAKLKNKSKKQNIPLQQLLNLFCQEEFIRRLSKSNYRNNLILKGGYLLYSISGFTTRPTVDSDYLLENYPNDIDTIENLVNEIISFPGKNDFIKFEIRKLEKISELKKYSGIRVNLTGMIGRTITPFSIDFGVGDVIKPSPVKRTLPVLLPELEQPEILTYSLESTVAEKLDAIIYLMEITGRMKDFYDIYYLATTFDFIGRDLQEAIQITLTNRNRDFRNDSVVVIHRLVNNSAIQRRWGNFCKKILKYNLDFNCVVNLIIDFTLPPYESIMKDEKFFKTWNSKKKQYI
jgi:predicted nucleotidyltransferase component of viral defense system